MSVTTNYIGNIVPPVSVVLTTTSKTDIGAAMDDDSITLASWIICNESGGSVLFKLFHYEDSTGQERLHWIKTIAAGDSQGASDYPIRMRVGDEMRAVGAASVTVNLIYTLSLPSSR